jgi:hypothetical protein
MVDSGLNETAIAWGDVSPGMVLKVMDGERIPAVSQRSRESAGDLFLYTEL